MLCIVVPGLARADCQSEKLTVVGLFARGYVCAARICHTGQTTCGSVVDNRVERAFARAEAGGGCSPPVTQAELGQELADASLDAALVYDDCRCVSGERRGLARYAAEVLKAYRRHQERPDPTRLGATLARSEARLVKRFGASQELASCTPYDPQPVIDAVDTLVERLLGKLYPVCEDDVQGGGEACDGTDAAACPGACLPDCTCP